ncbi:Protein of unknown function [Lactobacillus delbrueckii subsp. bulgaricus]|nr:Protein of unknown function [Lactobacillus delbrueckii subsp. bulgaricus]CDR75145.1 Protein of unknown function [Lactobacillus delbrueckii subsp. bulgaricus]
MKRGDFYRLSDE